MHFLFEREEICTFIYRMKSLSNSPNLLQRLISNLILLSGATRKHSLSSQFQQVKKNFGVWGGVWVSPMVYSTLIFHTFWIKWMKSCSPITDGREMCGHPPPTNLNFQPCEGGVGGLPPLIYFSYFLNKAGEIIFTHVFVGVSPINFYSRIPALKITTFQSSF